VPIGDSFYDSLEEAPRLDLAGLCLR